jgi:hypothetical protein
MKSLPRLAVPLACLCACLPLLAQTAPAAVTPATPAAPAAAASVPAASSRKVLEDDRVRIEETRMRGQVHNVVVHSKLPGVKSYEVIMPPLGKDPSQNKGAAGKRTWSLFDF